MVETIEELLEAPCIFCGYNGGGYYQAGTHNPSCPWYNIGGGAEREQQFVTVLKKCIRNYAALEREFQSFVEHHEAQTEDWNDKNAALERERDELKEELHQKLMYSGGEISRLEADNALLMKRLEVACHVKADDKVGFDFAILDKMDALERERDELKEELRKWRDSRDGMMSIVEKLEADNALLRKQMEVIKDDYLADKIAVDCHDKNHDDRWCPTCNARDIVIDEYRNAVNKEMELKEGK